MTNSNYFLMSEFNDSSLRDIKNYGAMGASFDLEAALNDMY